MTMIPSSNDTMADTPATLTTLANLPFTTLRSIHDAIASVNPFRFSCVQAAHIKLEAESMATAVFYVAKRLAASFSYSIRQIWAFVHARRVNTANKKKGGIGEVEKTQGKRSLKAMKKRKGVRRDQGIKISKIVAKGSITLIIS